MRKSTTLTFTVLAATALLLAGCDPILPSGGKSVKFTAHSKRQVTTKTVYSGSYRTENDKTFEDIYWKDGDNIRIYSSNTDVVATPDGTAYAEYSLDVSNETPTNAELVNDASNGLAWKQSGEVTFYAVYPPSTTGSTVGIFDMGIPTTQVYKVPTETVMDHAYMLATSKLSSMNDVSLNFYPAFTAFQINLKSLDDELTLKEFRILYLDPEYPENDYDIRLSGPYWGEIDADNNMSFLRYPYDDDFSSSFESTGYDFSQVRVAFPDGTKVTSGTNGTAVNFTLFTLPFMGGINGSVNENYMTNLWLEVSYWKNDSDHNPTGDPITKRLALTQEKVITTSDGDVTTTGFYQFGACKKYRLNGLAVGDKWKFKISLDPDQLPWDLTTEKTSFAQNIQSSAFKIKNAKETGNNYYPAGTKDYQVRTLDMDNNKTFFEVTFQPAAPMGGYWMLIPESNGGMGTGAFKIEVIDSEGNGSTDLKGQIMNQEVTLHITSMVTDDQRDRDHAIIIKSIFSTNAYFDENSSFSADSEIQDVHRDGSFSYWRFVIPAKND